MLAVMIVCVVWVGSDQAEGYKTRQEEWEEEQKEFNKEFDKQTEKQKENIDKWLEKVKEEQDQWMDQQWFLILGGITAFYLLLFAFVVD